VLPVSARALVGEALGTAMLLAIVVGSGIMGESLADGNTAIALLANSTATGLGLVVLVLMFAPISGAHFNPIVSVLEAARGGISAREAALRSVAQVLGACAGVVIAHAMFDRAAITLSTHARSGVGLGIGEAVATFGLVGVVTVLPRRRPEATAIGVGAYIASAYWFTSSTSFANPAVTLARTLTDTFTGIAPADVGAFVVAQAVGAVLGAAVFGWLAPPVGSAVAPETASAHKEPA
jgi:glycerol uptake facilitator-like aquaporin